MESTLEVLTTRKPGREFQRHWPDEVKAHIVSERLRPGAMLREVAERHGVKPIHAEDEADSPSAKPHAKPRAANRGSLSDQQAHCHR
ncbi:transposase [Agrobacterium rhizogenes]|nr:transposase [Rhizobium rhizogenes]NTG56149.1 transposase [Rhizobium rhizogenes]NTH01821.1 transposase [Rhizobium rhizogenes]NTI57532.1 transposase [Rhizobium rhizogenes]